ncbi:MAG TPA: hypothetical protein VIV40_08110 [Kofleriaceae bacterium]
MSFSDFSSWPRDQEQSFVVYEQRATESSKKAVTFGAIAGVLFLMLMVGIYAGVEPDRKDITKDMNMSNLTKRSKKVEAPAPAPTPAPAAAPAPAEAPAAAPAAPAEEKK